MAVRLAMTINTRKVRKTWRKVYSVYSQGNMIVIPRKNALKKNSLKYSTRGMLTAFMIVRFLEKK